ncbi:MAG: hypothetical protein JST11_26085 [Acidobacteria bacterium]|nr:hypothetical protein [Acidobacteriota bacterium]
MALLAVGLVLGSAYFSSNRAVDMDEMGLFNPSYMVARYGHLTYPIYGYPDKPVIVHPPIHTGTIGLFMRLGLTWYYAEATPVVLFLLFSVFVVASGPFSPPVKVGLLAGTAFLPAMPFVCLVFGTRPEGAVQTCWMAALLLLESGRLKRWDRRRLFGGAFLLAWASSLHYYAAVAGVGLLVYLVWAISSQGWKRARPSVFAMIAGAALFLIPYLLLYVIPYGGSILEAVRSVSYQQASPLQVHGTMYQSWSKWNALPAFVRAFLALGVPLAVWSTAILASIPATRGLALAALPLELITLFLKHMQIVYLTHEVEIFVTAAAVGLAVLLDWVCRHAPRAAWSRPALLAVLTFGFAVFLVRLDLRLTPPVLRAQIHEADVARAATRHIVGPGARIASYIGSWYGGGGAYWHEILNDLTYARSVDPRTYLAHFDFAVDNEFRSGESPKGTQRTLSYWYYTGLLKLRGFYMSDTCADLSLVFLTLDRPSTVLGYTVKQNRLSRFDQDDSGPYQVTVAACPARPELTYGTFSQLYPASSFVKLDLPPGPGTPAEIVTVLSPVGSAQPAGLLQSSCSELARVRGRLTPVDQDALVAAMRRDDPPMQFPQTLDEVPKTRPASTSR